jgi:hypothetical protein
MQYDRLCGLVVRVPGYRSGSLGFDSRNYLIIWEVVGLALGPLSLVRTTEELLEKKSSGSGLESLKYGRRGSTVLTTRHLSIRKGWHYLRRQATMAIVRSRTHDTEFFIIIMQCIILEVIYFRCRL